MEEDTRIDQNIKFIPCFFRKLAMNIKKNKRAEIRRREISTYSKNVQKFSVLFTARVVELPRMLCVPLNSLRTHIISSRYRIRVEIFRRRESPPLAAQPSIIFTQLITNKSFSRLASIWMWGGWNNLQKTLRWFSRAPRFKRKIYRRTSFKLVICNDLWCIEWIDVEYCGTEWRLKF